METGTGVLSGRELSAKKVFPVLWGKLFIPTCHCPQATLCCDLTTRSLTLQDGQLLLR